MLTLEKFAVNLRCVCVCTYVGTNMIVYVNEYGS